MFDVQGPSVYVYETLRLCAARAQWTPKHEDLYDKLLVELTTGIRWELTNGFHYTGEPKRRIVCIEGGHTILALVHVHDHQIDIYVVAVFFDGDGGDFDPDPHVGRRTSRATFIFHSSRGRPGRLVQMSGKRIPMARTRPSSTSSCAIAPHIGNPSSNLSLPGIRRAFAPIPATEPITTIAPHAFPAGKIMDKTHQSASENQEPELHSIAPCRNTGASRISTETEHSYSGAAPSQPQPFSPMNSICCDQVDIWPATPAIPEDEGKSTTVSDSLELYLRDLETTTDRTGVEYMERGAGSPHLHLT